MRNISRYLTSKDNTTLDEPVGYSVRIFMPQGQPDGVRIVSKSHWSGQGIVFPRQSMPDIRTLKIADGGCIYVLWGHDEDGEVVLPSAYVGRTDDIWTRLQSHSKDPSKAFWKQCVVFTSTDLSLNTAHTQHIEAKLIEVASKANLCQLVNESNPTQPPLSLADRADAERFFFDVMQCLPLCGVGFFVEPEQPTEYTQLLTLSEKQITARGYEIAGGFVVREGSEAVGEEMVANTMPISSRKLREELIKRGVIRLDNGKYKLNSDQTFNSPSQAAGVLLGASYNGLNYWKDTSGQTLNQIREAEINQP